jgi:SAM-dependent methyltransferase
MLAMKQSTDWAAYHWREYGLEQLLPNPADGRRVLLVGAGDAGERVFLHALGFQCLAFDIRASDGIDFRADAHRLPIADNSFDVVISMQVLEHLRSPWLAVQEMNRVLLPGGWCLGSVAFLKPFHASYYHMTHEGVCELMSQAGLQVDTLYGAQSVSYSVLGSILPFGRRSWRRVLLGSLDRILFGLRSFAWSQTRRMNANTSLDRFGSTIPMSFKQIDRLRFAPAVVFRAGKPRRGLAHPLDGAALTKGHSKRGDSAPSS